jgi:hypothetical protein
MIGGAIGGELGGEEKEDIRSKLSSKCSISILVQGDVIDFCILLVLLQLCVEGNVVEVLGVVSYVGSISQTHLSDIVFFSNS